MGSRLWCVLVASGIVAYGCQSSASLDDTSADTASPHIIMPRDSSFCLRVSAEGVVTLSASPVEVEGLASHLREIGAAKDGVVILSTSAGAPYAVVVALLNELRRGGYGNVVVTSAP